MASFIGNDGKRHEGKTTRGIASPGPEWYEGRHDVTPPAETGTLTRLINRPGMTANMKWNTLSSYWQTPEVLDAFGKDEDDMLDVLGHLRHNPEYARLIAEDDGNMLDVLSEAIGTKDAVAMMFLSDWLDEKDAAHAELTAVTRKVLSVV